MATHMTSSATQSKAVSQAGRNRCSHKNAGTEHRDWHDKNGKTCPRENEPRRGKSKYRG